LFEGASFIHNFARPPCFYCRFQGRREYGTGVEYHVNNNINLFKKDKKLGCSNKHTQVARNFIGLHFSRRKKLAKIKQEKLSRQA